MSRGGPGSPFTKGNGDPKEIVAKVCSIANERGAKLHN
jgi:hypothetical protein